MNLNIKTTAALNYACLGTYFLDFSTVLNKFTYRFDLGALLSVFVTKKSYCFVLSIFFA